MEVLKNIDLPLIILQNEQIYISIVIGSSRVETLITRITNKHHTEKNISPHFLQTLMFPFSLVL